MNQDPVYQRLKEIGWRRALTATEQTELRAWLASHPEALADIEQEAALDAALTNRSDVPVSSNFTARVMTAIERDEAAQRRAVSRPSDHWWRVFIPRFAVATVAIVCVTLGYRHNVAVQRMELSDAAKQIAESRALSDMAVIEDFETIRSLNSAEVAVDETLLSMSDDLLALNR
jgi:anti-sigma factor RsiW